MTDRIGKIRQLIEHLEGPRALLTPAEVLRAVKLMPGWGFGAAQSAAPGTYLVDAGDGEGERVMRRDRLIPFLQTTWLPAAKAELAKETTTP